MDKAAQERVLDQMQAEHPDLLITRVRPALVFDADAGAEITRYFLGALVPAAALRPGTLPLLPVPAGIQLQVVHADDLADAFCRVLTRRAGGAFNVATEPVLRAQELADVVDGGGFLEVPAALIRPAVAVAWKARAVAADPGWLDMGMRVPVMDTSRARDELGWEPKHGAVETLRELLTGIADGQGTASPPMRPREQWPADQSPPGGVDPSGVNERLTDSLMTPVLEVELMRSAVVGKLGGWETLAALAPDLGLPVELFTTLAERAREHADLFGRLHHHVAGSAFRTAGKEV